MLLQIPLESSQITYLKKIGMLFPDEKIRDVQKAGEGNMNVTLTIKTDKRTFVLKQSRPYVAKYPEVPAPSERTEIEYQYYQTLKENPSLASFSPEVLDFDRSSWLLALAYLEDGKDFTRLYEKESFIKEESIDLLLNYLKQLHQLVIRDFPDNQKMKQLNHQHIFILPYLKENGFNLNQVQEGLQQLSSVVKDNPLLRKKIEVLGERYLGQGKVLLHGDFYPGSWLATGKGLKIIDTEFAFLGDPEFDLGIMLAHLKMAQVSEALIQYVIKSYPLENALLAQYTGVEILRRLFGLAQLPLTLSLSEKKALAIVAVNLIIDEKI